MPYNDIPVENRQKETFIIQVQFHQNSTWQGAITWTDQKKTRHFRSTLEMIKLIDDALSAHSEQDNDNSPVWE